uniref:Uncharacterized protein n=1 Tax=Cacopsylla melanoneura TaxID=428564 RepID=A0A8D9AJR8_9HEMI
MEKCKMKEPVQGSRETQSGIAVEPSGMENNVEVSIISGTDPTLQPTEGSITSGADPTLQTTEVSITSGTDPALQSTEGSITCVIPPLEKVFHNYLERGLRQNASRLWKAKLWRIWLFLGRLREKLDVYQFLQPTP